MPDIAIWPQFDHEIYQNEEIPSKVLKEIIRSIPSAKKTKENAEKYPNCKSLKENSTVVKCVPIPS